MKLGVIGAGAVGTATAMAVALGGHAREMVIIDRDRSRTKAIATDMRYGTPLSGLIDISDGDYEDLAGAGVIILAAGVNEKSGGATDRNDMAGRLRLLEANYQVFEDVVPKLVKAAPNVPILVLTDPPDPLVDVARHFAGHGHVLATSTYLDSLRFRVHLANRLNVNAAYVDAGVVGEHGMSSVFLWSSARVGGTPIQEILERRRVEFAAFKKELEEEVRQANITIIEGTGASQYGIGMVAAAVAKIILRDERAVIPVSSYNSRFGTALSLPSVVGRQGVSEILCPALSPDEALAVERSADTIRRATARYLRPD